MTFAPNNALGNTYLPTYRNYQLEPDILNQALSRDYVSIAYAVNTKTNGVFETVETQNGEQFYSLTADLSKKRYVFRKCFTLGAVATGTTATVAHGITNAQQYTCIYGVCFTDVNDSRPLPYASVTANANIEINVTSTSIVINNGAASPNIVSGVVILEYIKQ